jgi:hypothetical protein
MIDEYLYELGSGLEVPGIEAVLEYGDASRYAHGEIPGALRINDRSKPDQVHIKEISGLNDDPDAGDSRTDRAGHLGERAGNLVPRGRTIGLTGDVRAGNVARMRDLWRRFRSQFGRREQDLVVHPPLEAVSYTNEIWSGDLAAWETGAPVLDFVPDTHVAFTDGTISGVDQSWSDGTGQPPAGSTFVGWKEPIPWSGEDVWMTALVAVRLATSTIPSLALVLRFLDASGSVVATWTATGTGIQSSPATGTYYLLRARMTANDLVVPGAVSVQARVLAGRPVALGDWAIRVARTSLVLLTPDTASPAGWVDAALPGYEPEGVASLSRSYGPCYSVNQARDPDSTTSASWANDSTSGAAVANAGSIVYGWPEGGRTSSLWQVSNPNTTSRTLALRMPGTLSDPNLLVVAGGRSYRVHLRLLIRELFATSALTVVWLDRAGTTISSSSVGVADPLASGGAAVDVSLDAVVVAPAVATRAYLRFASLTTSATSGQKMWAQLAEPRFIDVSEYDLGDVDVDAGMDPEVGVTRYLPLRAGTGVALVPSGAIRRIPRPFLLRRVRALWDSKAPESQRNLQYRRDFTMSMRASDPRIYVLDERHSQLRMSIAKMLVSRLMSAFKVALDAPWATVASDGFTGATSGGALSGRTAPVGGAWATSGDTTDFTFTGALGFEQITRATSADSVGRYAVLNASAFADVDVSTGAAVFGISGSSNSVFMGVIARWVGSNDNLIAFITQNAGSATAYLQIRQKVAGVSTESATAALPASGNYVIRLVVSTSGRSVAQVLDAAGTVRAQCTLTTTALARGSVLATGGVGIWDAANTASTRYYDNFVVRSPLVSSISAPADFTRDGTSFDPVVGWKTNEYGSPFPLDGVGLGPDDASAFASRYLSQASLERVYYSAGALTYTTPQVTVSGNCVSGEGFDYDLFSDSHVGSTWQYNYIGALLKRVSSSAWIELRYNSANKAQMNAAHASPAAPYSLELWCSHDTSGSPAVTRLAGWDVPTTNVIDGTRKNLRAYMDSTGTVYAELWDFNAPNLNDVGLIARQSFLLPGALAAVVGPTIAGRTGMMASLGRWDDGTGAGINVATMLTNYGPPYLSSFEAVDFNTALQLINCPVIGDVNDVPLRIELRGGIDSPTIALSRPESGKHASLALTGVFTDDDPVTIDMDNGTIKSASGANYFSRRQLGSRFFSLGSGQNIITVQAADWDSAAPAHVIASWRDALK